MTIDGQEILIGEDVRIRVVALRGKYVSLAIAAPASVRVLRDELARKPLEFEAVDSNSAADDLRPVTVAGYES